MNNIVLNYKITKNIDQNRIENIIYGCLSKKYKISLNIYDFSLSKNIKKYLQNLDTFNIDISIFNHDYEDFSNADNIIFNNLIQYGNSIGYGIFPENLLFNNNSLDRINFDLFNNEINGLIYFDYMINNTRCFLKSRSMNFKLNVPGVFWSTNKLIKYISEKDKLNIVANNFAAIHIPNSLCNILTND